MSNTKADTWPWHESMIAYETAIARAKAAFGEAYRKERRPPPGRDVDRPCCAWCGKRACTRRVTYVRHTAKCGGDPANVAPYKGPGTVLEERLTLLADMDGQGTPGAMYSATVWIHGEYKLAYEPFCTLRCALAFARSAHRAGMRRTTQEKAA